METLHRSYFSLSRVTNECISVRNCLQLLAVIWGGRFDCSCVYINSSGNNIESCCTAVELADLGSVFANLTRFIKDILSEILLLASLLMDLVCS